LQSRDSEGGHDNPAFTPDEDESENRASVGSDPSKPLKELYTLRALPKVTMFGHSDANYPNFFLRVGAISKFKLPIRSAKGRQYEE
jgi:predicted acyl esterase